MFRIQRRGFRSVCTSPHARGDVPATGRVGEAGFRFSPRPWGCSADVDRPAVLALLLPTPVGMFREQGRHGRPREASPHARGDVPQTEISGIVKGTFSPRPWGCSDAPRDREAAARLLPTPVGMFRQTGMNNNANPTSPHARGDVPRFLARQAGPPTFSPRPWGCSAPERNEQGREGLLPTPVGMFRPRRTGWTGGRPSPHARGDVPFSSRLAFRDDVFSPRPWGCSVAGRRSARGCRLLPTPVVAVPADAGPERFGQAVERAPPRPYARHGRALRRRASGAADGGIRRRAREEQKRGRGGRGDRRAGRNGTVDRCRDRKGAARGPSNCSRSFRPKALSAREGERFGEVDWNDRRLLHDSTWSRYPPRWKGCKPRDHAGGMGWHRDGNPRSDPGRAVQAGEIRTGLVPHLDERDNRRPHRHRRGAGKVCGPEHGGELRDDGVRRRRCRCRVRQHRLR